MNLTVAMMFAVGACSAAAYLRRRAWMEALLVLIMAAALGAMLGDFSLPGTATSQVLQAGLGPQDVRQAARLELAGDGLRAAEWRDLPVRPLDWKAPTTPAMQLQFPRETWLGRAFDLQLRGGPAGAARLQLLDENGELLAEAKGSSLSVSWLPPTVEDLVLKARVLDGAGKVLAEGPVPVRVLAPSALQVTGRLYAPSFDAEAVHGLLAQAGADIDWQATMGKSLARSETARKAFDRPALSIIDAGWFEHAAAAARAALLAQAAQGTALIILGANANDTAVWEQSLQLGLRPSAGGEAATSGLSLGLAALAPQTQGPWQPAGPQMAVRDWKQGRIVWLGVADWHRHAIAAPQALGLWWQGLLDLAHVRRIDPVQWQVPEPMPVVRERLEICASGITEAAQLPQLKQTIAWQARPEHPDLRCVAAWPREAGWLDIRSGTAHHRVYVFGESDWPLWQAAQRRQATEAYAASTAEAPASIRRPLPAWPFALAFMLAAFLLWWRERA